MEMVGSKFFYSTVHVYNIFDRNTYGKLNEKITLVEFSLLSLLAFAVPMIISHPQILTGSIINAILIYAALRFRARHIMPLIVLPSISVVIKGVLFGPLTPFVMIIMPFIWMGNATIIYLIKKFYIDEGKHYLLSLVISSLTKALIIGIPTLIISHVISIPQPIVAGMSIVQFITAVIGGIIVYVIHRLRRSLQYKEIH